MPRDRRPLLGHTLAAGALLASTRLFAAPPLAGGMAHSVHRMKLGAFEVAAVLDGFRPMS